MKRVTIIQTALAIILVLQAGLLMVAAMYAPGLRLYLLIVGCMLVTALMLWHVSRFGTE